MKYSSSQNEASDFSSRNLGRLHEMTDVDVRGAFRETFPRKYRKTVGVTYSDDNFKWGF